MLITFYSYTEQSLKCRTIKDYFLCAISKSTYYIFLCFQTWWLPCRAMGGIASSTGTHVGICIPNILNTVFYDTEDNQEIIPRLKKNIFQFNMGQGNGSGYMVPAADPKSWAESQGSQRKERATPVDCPLTSTWTHTHVSTKQNLTKLFKKKSNFKKANSHSPKHHLYSQHMKTEAKVTSISNFVELLKED